MCLADVMQVGELMPVEETALLTEYARALDSRLSRSILHDTPADEVVGKIDYDFTGLGVMPSTVRFDAFCATSSDSSHRSTLTCSPRPAVSKSARGAGHRYREY
jgi:O-methyltransferase involved in polyketide biosynthesis